MSVCQVSPQVDDTVVASLSFQFGKICSQLAGELQRCLHTIDMLLPAVAVSHQDWVSVTCTSVTGCVSESLSDEQKAQLLHRFKLLCLTGLHAEGKQTNSNDQSTLIRCNCCYNLPVQPAPRVTGGGPSEVLMTSVRFFPLRPCWCFPMRPPS